MGNPMEREVPYPLRGLDQTPQEGRGWSLGPMLGQSSGGSLEPNNYMKLTLAVGSQMQGKGEVLSVKYGKLNLSSVVLG